MQKKVFLRSDNKSRLHFLKYLQHTIDVMIPTNHLRFSHNNKTAGSA